MLYIAIAITFTALIGAVFFDVFLGYPLFLSYVVFAILSAKRGFKLSQISKMSWGGIKKALIVVPTFLMIGMLTASWLQSGTIPALVVLGMEFITPEIFVVSSFWLCAVMSMLLGSSFGSTSTMGIVLITIARTSGIDINLVAGAIICGVYVGDRSSPMSTCVALTSTVSKSSFYPSVKKSIKSSIIPFIISSILFYISSMNYNIQWDGLTIAQQIQEEFTVGLVPIIPALIIITMCLLKINMKVCILVSSLSAAAISILVQGAMPTEVLNTFVFGFNLPETSAIKDLISGGGIMSMFSAAVVVLVSCCIAGVFEGSKFISEIKGQYKVLSPANRFLKTIYYSLATSTIFCNQTATIIMTDEMVKSDYEKDKTLKTNLFLDLITAAATLPTMIPWNVAIYVPIQVLGVTGVGYMQFLYYIFALNIVRYLHLLIKGKKKS